MIGCGAPLDIIISHGDGGALADGEYLVKIELDGELADTLSCVPGGTNECDSTPGVGIVSGTMDGTSIRVSFFVPDGDEPPDSIQVEVSFDDELLGSQSLQPSWTMDYPNVEGCEPTCWSADDAGMEIDRPTAAE